MRHSKDNVFVSSCAALLKQMFQSNHCTFSSLPRVSLIGDPFFVNEMVQSFSLGQSFGKSYLQIVCNRFQFDAFIAIIKPSLLFERVDVLKLHPSASQIQFFEQFLKLLDVLTGIGGRTAEAEGVQHILELYLQICRTHKFFVLPTSHLIYLLYNPSGSNFA